MPHGYRVLTPADTATAGGVRDLPIAVEVLTGLSGRPKRLSSRYFYDDIGSELFARICDLPEYYPTRCEHAILTAHQDQIRALAMDGGEPLNVVDLGAGDGRKTRVLLEHFLAARVPLRYVPIDISEGAMRSLVERTRAALPGLDVQGLVSDHADGISWLAAQRPARRNLVLFLGSSIGNFRPAEARALLWRLWDACADGDLLLVGFDLKKDVRVLLDAYNDSAGLASAFNKNLLQRINVELGGDFQLDRFSHFATYNVTSGAMESYLLSNEAQIAHVRALNAEFEFLPFEPIHIEYSYKFLVSDIEELAAALGLAVERYLFDERRWFLDALWRVSKAAPNR